MSNPFSTDDLAMMFQHFSIVGWKFLPLTVDFARIWLALTFDLDFNRGHRSTYSEYELPELCFPTEVAVTHFDVI